MRLYNFVFVLLFLGLAVPGVFAEPPVDIQTSFEYEETNGRFIFGGCPGCAVFENGVASAVPDAQLALNGTNAWMVNPGSTGVITFEIPARNLSFFFKDQTAGVQSVLTLRDVNGAILQTVNGSPSGPETNGFTKVEVTNSSVKTITLRNNSNATNPATLAVLENLMASFNEPPPLVLVDSLLLPRFADGTFEAAGVANTFLTEATITNTGNYAEVRMQAFDDQGQPLGVTIEDQVTNNGGTDSSFTYKLEPAASVAITTIGLGDGTIGRGLISGYWTLEVRRLEGQQPAEGGKVEMIGVLSRRQGTPENQVVLYEAGVSAARNQRRFRLPLNSNGDMDTGLGLVNPPSATSPTTVNLSVWDHRFERRIASASFDLPPGHATSKFIWEYIEQFGQNVTPELLATLQESLGIVEVTSNTGTAPMGLRQNNPFGVFPQTVPTLTTIPVVTQPVAE